MLDSEPTADVVFTFTSSDTTEGTVSPSSITFNAANYDTPQTITVVGVNDNVDDGDISYIVSGAASSSDANYNSIAVSDVSVDNTDDETGNEILLYASYCWSLIILYRFEWLKLWNDINCKQTCK